MLAGKRARMNNIQIYVLISFGCILFIGAWAFYLAMKLQKSLNTIAKLKQENYNLRTPF